MRQINLCPQCGDAKYKFPVASLPVSPDRPLSKWYRIKAVSVMLEHSLSIRLERRLLHKTVSLVRKISSVSYSTPLYSLYLPLRQCTQNI
jgi:hypothetical protein